MKKFTLTKEEKQILKDAQNGKFVSVKNLAKAKREAVAAARNTLNKTKNINIRLSERVLAKLKAKAVEQGIPYQTLVSSILHRYTNKSDCL